METKAKIEDKLKREFGASQELKNEFGSIEAYLGFRRAERGGRVRGMKSSVVRGGKAGTGPAAGDVDEAAVKAEFFASADLQAEFDTVDAYVAFKRAEKNGRTKMCVGKGVVAFSSAPDLREERKKSSSGASSRISEEMIHRDELRQYERGAACNSCGVPCSS